MKLFSWVTKDTSIDFMKPRKLTYALSVLMMVFAVGSIAVRGFNYGIDFSGGILIEIKSPQTVDLDALRSQLKSSSLKDITLQAIGKDGTEVMIRAQAEGMNEKQQNEAIKAIQHDLGGAYEYRRVELVGPQVGDELKTDGIVASIIAILGISLYIWIRFEWHFAVGALVGLIHDIVVTVGLLSFFQLDFNLTTVAAILTLAGYSVNDTVVTYDRIRENLRKFRKMEKTALLNKSINDIFSRTILTGLTTLLAASSLLVFGGEALRSFSFTIVWGIIIGTYSSIYVSGVLLNLFDLKAIGEEKNHNPFGNVD